MQNDQKIAVLRKSPIFAAMPQKVLLQIAGHCEAKQFAAGNLLFSKGEQADETYVLVRGHVRHPEVEQPLHQFSIVQEVMLEGAIFGYAGMIEGRGSRIISAVAVKDTEVLTINGAYLRGLLRDLGREGHSYLQDLSRSYAAHEYAVAGQKGWVSIRNAGKVYDPSGKHVVAVDNCSIEIRPGEFCAIVGPSGCGKSTLMNAIAGFEQLTSGEVLLDGELINSPGQTPQPGPDRIVVFQNGALFPWATIRENLIRGPVVQGRMTEQEALEKARSLLQRVGLADIENLYPGSISSGMCRRVEIIRGILNDPRVLLLDEPFRGLDALTKTVTQTALLELYDLSRKTVLFITHDLEEAIYLADRVLVMTTRPGHIKQTIEIDLPRPRDARLLTQPEFIRLKELAIEAVHEEAVKAFNAGEKEFA